MQLELSSISLFNDLNNEQLNVLSQIIYIKEYKEGEFVFIEGGQSDVFYIIHTGKMKIVKSSIDGKEKILEIMTDGDFLGEMGVIEDKPRSANGVAITQLKLLYIEKGDFLKLIRNNPIIALKIIVELGRRLRRANKDIELLAFFDVETRLKELFERMAVSVEGSNVKVLEKITHHQIADHIGTSRETVTRLINKMVDKKLIEIRKDNIVLRNLEEW